MPYSHSTSLVLRDPPPVTVAFATPLPTRSQHVPLINPIMLSVNVTVNRFFHPPRKPFESTVEQGGKRHIGLTLYQMCPAWCMCYSMLYSGSIDQHTHTDTPQHTYR